MAGLSEGQLQGIFVRSEQVLRSRFERAAQAGELKVTDWVAPTGLGRFDAKLNLATHRYDVTIRVFYELQDDPRRDFIAWDGIARRRFKERAKQEVEQNWSERYTLACCRPGWEKYFANVHVHLVEETDLGSAHFKLLVKRRPETARSQGGGVNFSREPPECDIDSLAVLPKAQRRVQEGIFNMRERMLSEALKSNNCEVITFGHRQSILSVESRLRLNKYAQYVSRVLSEDVMGIQIYVYGATGGVSIGGTGQKRARAVSSYLTARVPRAADSIVAVNSVDGAKRQKVINILRRHLDQPTKNNTRFSGAVLFVHTPEGVRREAERNYIVLVHEVGHILGLPDEYFGRLHPLLTQKIALNTIIPQTLRHVFSQVHGRQQERLVQHQLGMESMLSGAGPHVPAPVFMTHGEILPEDARRYQTESDEYYRKIREIQERHGGQRKTEEERALKAPVAPLSLGSSSIMYGGMDIMPAHYLTIWSSLGQATSEYLDPREWKIVPSKANPRALRFFQA